MEMYKSRLVAKGYSQQKGLDYTETFSPVDKMVTVRVIVALAAASGWYVFQMDVHNAFLQGDLLEEVYVHVPNGFSRHECQVRNRLQEWFRIKDLGELKYFLCIEFSRSQKGIVMCQRKYDLELVSELGLARGKPAATPLEFNHKLTSIEFEQEIPNDNTTDDKELEEKGSY